MNFEFDVSSIEAMVIFDALQWFARDTINVNETDRRIAVALKDKLLKQIAENYKKGEIQ